MTTGKFEDEICGIFSEQNWAACAKFWEIWECLRHMLAVEDRFLKFDRTWTRVDAMQQPMSHILSTQPLLILYIAWTLHIIHLWCKDFCSADQCTYKGQIVWIKALYSYHLALIYVCSVVWDRHVWTLANSETKTRRNGFQTWQVKSTSDRSQIRDWNSPFTGNFSRLDISSFRFSQGRLSKRINIRYIATARPANRGILDRSVKRWPWPLGIRAHLEC